MVQTMGCPKSFDLHNIFPPAVGGSNMFPSTTGGSEVAEYFWDDRWILSETIQVNRKPTG